MLSAKMRMLVNCCKLQPKSICIHTLHLNPAGRDRLPRCGSRLFRRDLPTLEREALGQHQCIAALPSRQQQPHWTFQLMHNFHLNIAISKACAVFSTTCTNPHQCSVQWTHLCLFGFPDWPQNGGEECHSTELSLGWGHSCWALPLPTTCRWQMQCGDCTVTMQHHRGLGGCCHSYHCWGEPCEFALLWFQKMPQYQPFRLLGITQRTLPVLG